MCPFFAHPCAKTSDFSWDLETFAPTSKEELESWELPASLGEYAIKTSKCIPEKNLKDSIL